MIRTWRNLRTCQAGMSWAGTKNATYIMHCERDCNSTPESYQTGHSNAFGYINELNKMLRTAFECTDIQAQNFQKVSTTFYEHLRQLLNIDVLNHLSPASLSVCRFSLHYPHKISCFVIRIKQMIIYSYLS